jgi:TPP-dependent pyruvate/acetoin dehydrogenase alpha subunit
VQLRPAVRRGEIPGFIRLGDGQEAAYVGLMAALRAGGTISSTPIGLSRSA